MAYVMPSIDIVNIASRPMVIVTPLVSAAVPYLGEGQG